MISCEEKNIYENIKSKLHEYVQDYVVAALALNVTDWYLDLESYWEKEKDGFNMEQIERLLKDVNIEALRISFDKTCSEIGELFIDMYKDLLCGLRACYASEIDSISVINSHELSLSSLKNIKENIVNLLKDEEVELFDEFEKLEKVVTDLNLYLPQLNYLIKYYGQERLRLISRLINKLTGTWRCFIQKYYLITNLYLDDIYPKQVNAIYEEVLHSLLGNIFEIQSVIKKNNPHINKGDTFIANYYNNILK